MNWIHLSQDRTSGGQDTVSSGSKKKGGKFIY
jgi:hypothetical protein